LPPWGPTALPSWSSEPSVSPCAKHHQHRAPRAPHEEPNSEVKSHESIRAAKLGPLTETKNCALDRLDRGGVHDAHFARGEEERGASRVVRDVRVEVNQQRVPGPQRVVGWLRATQRCQQRYRLQLSSADDAFWNQDLTHSCMYSPVSGCSPAAGHAPSICGCGVSPVTPCVRGR
jgi:hypothetical protein